MPAVSSGKVLITGANGFMASWIMKDLLSRGFSVRGTVRSAAQIPDRSNLFPELADPDRLEFVIVSDIVVVRSFFLSPGMCFPLGHQ